LAYVGSSGLAFERLDKGEPLDQSLARRVLRGVWRADEAASLLAHLLPRYPVAAGRLVERYPRVAREAVPAAIPLTRDPEGQLELALAFGWLGVYDETAVAVLRDASTVLSRRCLAPGGHGRCNPESGPLELSPRGASAIRRRPLTSLDTRRRSQPMTTLPSIARALTVASALVLGWSACAVSDSGGGEARGEDAGVDGLADVEPGDDGDGGAGLDAPSDDAAGDGPGLDGDDAPDCVPQCGDRRCGPDPVCGSSCGTCASGTCDGGMCVNTGGPVIHELQTSRTRVLEGESVTFSAVVSDPDGDLLGGVLRDAEGTTIAPFAAAGAGVFSVALSWDEFHAHSPLSFTGTVQRVFAGEFFDAADNRARREVTLTFDCQGGTACDGVCVDLSSDPSNCGACARKCGRYSHETRFETTCELGRCVEWYGCLLRSSHSELTCSQYCASLGGSCSTGCRSDGRSVRAYQNLGHCEGDVPPGSSVFVESCPGTCSSPLGTACGLYSYGTCCCEGVDPGP
jgi:hypothetical protein